MSDVQPTVPGTDIALLPPAERALVVLKSTEAEKQLRELVARTEPISAPVDAAGREEVHRAAMDHKNARVAIEKAGKAAREDATAFSKAVITEEKRLVAINAAEETRLFELRDTYDTKVRQEKEEADRKERERVAAIREKIEGIKNLPVASAADDSVTLTDTLTDLREFEITFEDFAEFQDEANTVRTAAIASLENMLNAALAREAAEAAQREAEAKLAAQREELERQQRELAEQRAQIERERAELEAQKNVPPEGWMEAGEAYDQQQARLAERDKLDARMSGVTDVMRGGTVVAGPNEPEPEVVSMVALDQPRQRAENAAVAYILDNTPPSPLPESERRVIVEPEFAGFDMAGGPDVHVEMVTITRDEYESLLTRSRWLECLEEAGVDNWEGIDEALRLNRERVPA